MKKKRKTKPRRAAAARKPTPKKAVRRKAAPAREPAHEPWCVKTEPGQYSWADLVRDGKTTWEGVSNPLALLHLRAMKRGDRVLVYHSGGESAVVGLARVVRGAYPDPALPDPKRVVVDLEPVAAATAPVPMSAVRAEPACAGMALVRIPRLSVMPVPPAAYAAIARLGGLPA